MILRARLGLLLGLTVLLFCGGPIAAQDKNKDRPGISPVKVDDAIRRGVAYLKSKLNAETAWKEGNKELRQEGLVFLALIHGGLAAEDPLYQALENRAATAKLETVYGVSLQAMILEEVDRVKYQRKILQCAQYLIDNQCKNGQWDYGQPSKAADEMQPPIPSKDTATGGTKSKDSDEKGSKPKVKRRIPIQQKTEGPPSGDNSNAQYAALGLRACHNSGILIPKKVVMNAARWWEKSQKQDGGWCYKGDPDHSKHESYGHMTAGGVASLMIFRHMMNRPWQRDKQVVLGMKWLATNFNVETPQGHNCRHNHTHQPEWMYYYYIYAVERAGVLFGADRMGKHWWYEEGAEYLMKQQKIVNQGGKDTPVMGSWSCKFGGDLLTDTAWAILFLKRSTAPLVESKDDRFKKKNK